MSFGCSTNTQALQMKSAVNLTRRTETEPPLEPTANFILRRSIWAHNLTHSRLKSLAPAKIPISGAAELRSTDCRR